MARQGTTQHIPNQIAPSNPMGEEQYYSDSEDDEFEGPLGDISMVNFEPEPDTFPGSDYERGTSVIPDANISFL